MRSKGVLEWQLLELKVDCFLVNDLVFIDRLTELTNCVGVIVGDHEVVVPIDKGIFWVIEFSRPKTDSGVGSIAYGEGVSKYKALIWSSTLGVNCSGSHHLSLFQFLSLTVGEFCTPPILILSLKLPFSGSLLLHHTNYTNYTGFFERSQRSRPLPQVNYINYRPKNLKIFDFRLDREAITPTTLDFSKEVRDRDRYPKSTTSTTGKKI